MKVLVTGGAGYIGSHACVALLNAGYDVVVIDNLCNSSAESLSRVRALTGRTLNFVQADLCDAAALDDLFRAHTFDAVMHFAGLKAVGESVAFPLRYYRNNVIGSTTLLETMLAHGVKQLVFSSSTTVYGWPSKVPIDESAPVVPVNAYGRSKAMIETIIADWCTLDPTHAAINLRYFNPVGAHPSGQLGEDPRGIPNNLMPFVAQVAVGRQPKLRVFGDDYPTADGTGVRDYIHVVDLVEGHLAALSYLQTTPGLTTVNLGTGQGVSVLDLVRAFERACGKPIPYDIVARRPGDVAACYADPSLADRLLGWRTQRDLDAMCGDAWRFQQQNPNGYGG